MEAVRIVTGTAVPLDRSDVDTDQIIPSDWLKQVERTGFEKGLFSEWRDDRDFVLNQEQYAGATILIGGPTGTGSSAACRASTALVPGSVFGDIFPQQLRKNGCCSGRLARGGRQLLGRRADPRWNHHRRGATHHQATAIGLPPFARLRRQHRILEGLDTSASRRQGDDITEYETHRQLVSPR